MLFLKRVQTEQADEYDGVTRSQLDVDAASGRIILKQTFFSEGEELHSWTSSVLARDLNPDSVTVSEPDSENTRHLEAVCTFYRDAISAERSTPGPPPQHQRFVRFRIPLTGKVHDADAVIASFRKFIADCGGKPPDLAAVSVEDLLEPMRAALAPASGVVISSMDRRTQYRQTAWIDSTRLLLIVDDRRLPGGVESIPLDPELQKEWGIAEFPLPGAKRHSFELLSLDAQKESVDCRQIPDFDLWIVSLYSVERLETTHQEDSSGITGKWWYVKVIFSDRTSPERFAKVCASAIEPIRERLYSAHVSH